MIIFNMLYMINTKENTILAMSIFALYVASFYGMIYLVFYCLENEIFVKIKEKNFNGNRKNLIINNK